MREQITQYPPIKRRASAEQGQLVQRRGSALSPNTEEEEAPDSYYDTRMPTSARRYYPNTNEEVYEQGNRRIVVHRGPPPKPKRHFHWLFWVGLAMVLLFGGWWALGKVETWWTNQQNTWSYGYPRTYQTDAVVGHNDSAANPSHFIALNLNGHIEVIELPGGDGTHAKIYIGPTLFSDDAGLVPVTLTFSDVNGDGKPDMEIHIQDQTIIFLNDGTQFKTPKQ
jgi:hypothetical protein